MTRVARVYAVRMARVNVSIPDELYAVLKAAGVSPSRVLQDAAEAELARQERARGWQHYLAELDDELGPLSPEEIAAAKVRADQIFGPEVLAARSA